MMNLFAKLAVAFFITLLIFSNHVTHGQRDSSRADEKSDQKLTVNYFRNLVRTKYWPAFKGVDSVNAKNSLALSWVCKDLEQKSYSMKIPSYQFDLDFSQARLEILNQQGTKSDFLKQIIASSMLPPEQVLEASKKLYTIKVEVYSKALEAMKSKDEKKVEQTLKELRELNKKFESQIKIEPKPVDLLDKLRKQTKTEEAQIAKFADTLLKKQGTGKTEKLKQVSVSGKLFEMPMMTVHSAYSDGQRKLRVKIELWHELLPKKVLDQKLDGKYVISEGSSRNYLIFYVDDVRISLIGERNKFTLSELKTIAIQLIDLGKLKTNKSN